MRSTIAPTAPPEPQRRPETPRPARPRRWPELAGYLAAAWAALAATVALTWTVTGDGFPFGPNDPDPQLSLLRGLRPEVGAPLFAAVLLATAVAALAMAGRHAARLNGLPRRLLLGFGWIVVVALLAVVADMRLLALAGYAPMLLIGAPFGWPPVDYAQVFTPTLITELAAVAGGLLLARTVLAWQFRTTGACAACGRAERAAAAAAPGALARWGRPMTYLAAAIPAVYAVSRLSWLAGIPLGISRQMLRDLHATGGVWAGAGLGTFALVGAVLTIGLVRPWGEVFPRWMVGLAGRRVPVALAVVPATLVSVVVTSAGLDVFASGTFLGHMADGDWAAVAPALLWPLWGPALGTATLAYYLRRRGRCGSCGRL